jgi:DNA-binding transcriptional ArsR family regulator
MYLSATITVVIEGATPRHCVRVVILGRTVLSADRKPATELSHNQIAVATKLSRRTVIRSISRLQDADLIETEKNDQWHRGNANRISVASRLLLPVEVGPSVTQRRRARSSH